MFAVIGVVSAQAQALSGNYTVGTSGDYTTVAAAASALISNGVSGPVTMTIDDGTYTGQVTLGSYVTGSSATNTITFESKSADSTKVVLTNTGTYTIYLYNADWITFKDMTINNTSTYGYCVRNWYGEHNSFKSLKLNNPYYGMYNYYSKYTTVDMVGVRGGYMGMYFYNASSDFGVENNITNSYSHNTSQYGLYYYYQRDGLVDRNDVDSTNYGFYSYYGNNNVITNNRFNCAYYHYIAYQNNNYTKTGDSCLIMNNQFINGGASSYGIYGYQGNKIKWYHNSFDLKGTAYGAYWYYPTGCDFMNNNIKMDASTYGMYMYQTPTRMDYNNMDFNASTYCYFGTRTHASLAALKTAYTGFHQNSMDENPEFDDPGVNLRSASAVLNNAGLKLGHPLVRTDIDRNLRPNKADAPKVDIGCNDFYLSPYDLDIKALISPMSVSLTSNEISVLLKNGGSGTISSTTVTLEYSIDGGKNWESENLSISSLAPGKEMQFDFKTLWTNVTAGKYTVMVRISKSVTGDPDKLDQEEWDVCTGVSGTYTIGSRKGADFATFKDAVKELQCGIAGPVVFNVQAGTYTENVVIGQTLGASATNTVSFVSPSRDSVTLRSTAGNTITLAGSDYVSFEGMKLRMDGSAGFTVSIPGGASHNEFTDCWIYNNTSITNTNANAITISMSTTSYSSGGNGGSYNIFRDNDIEGGYFNVSIYGANGNSPTGNEFHNNNFSKAYYYGLYTYYVDGLVAHDNIIDNFRYQYNYSMYLYYATNFDVQRNYLKSYYYVYAYYANRNSTSKIPAKFINNQLICTGTSYALYGYYISKTQFWHNSV